MGKRVISGHAFQAALYKAGLVPDNCTRVIIDADANGLTTIHYSVFGDETLLRIVEIAKKHLVEEVSAEPLETEAAA